MAKIRRSIKQQPLADRIINGNEIATACTGNPNASTLTTPLAALATKNTALQTKVSAAQAGFDAWQALVALQNTAADEWNAAFDTLADAAGTATGGDAGKIESLGLSAYTQGGAPAIGLPAQVLNLVATTGDFEGTMDTAWDKVRGASSYIIQKSPDPITGTSWTLAGVSTKSSATISGLTSGQKYWFRVAAVGAAGQGPWSDPATKIAG